MGKQAATVQEQCIKCQNIFDQMESCAVLTTSDWRVPFLEYLIEGILPDDHEETYLSKRLVTRYFVEGGILFKKGFNGEPLRCLGTLEAQLVMQEVHARECGDHQGKRRLLQQLLNLGHFWPTMKQDAAECVKTCHTCQVHGNLIHTHPTKPPKHDDSLAITYLGAQFNRSDQSTIQGSYLDISGHRILYKVG